VPRAGLANAGGKSLGESIIRNCLKPEIFYQWPEFCGWSDCLVWPIVGEMNDSTACFSIVWKINDTMQNHCQRGPQVSDKWRKVNQDKQDHTPNGALCSDSQRKSRCWQKQKVS
jgi:hypothetical protein